MSFRGGGDIGQSGGSYEVASPSECYNDGRSYSATNKRRPSLAQGAAAVGDDAAPQKKAKPDPSRVASTGMSAAASNRTATSACRVPETEEAQKRAYQACLRDVNKDVSYITPQAFQPPMGFNELKRVAAEETLKRLSNIRRSTSNYDDDDDSLDDSYPPPPGATRQVTSTGLTQSEKDFISALLNCTPLNAGFNVLWHKASYICYCPCGIDLGPWRKEHGISVFCGDQVAKRDPCRKKFAPNDLMDHLKREGGRYEETERGKKVTRPLKDIHHHATRVYLECLCRDWCGRGISHKALHPPLSKAFHEAQDAEIGLKERALIIAERTIRKDAEEKEKLRKEKERFQELAEDAQRRAEKLEKVRDKFAITKKVEEELTVGQIAKYAKMTTLSFDNMKGATGGLKHVTIEVLEDSASSGPTGGGFRLQYFFDNLWKKKSGDAHAALFGSNTGSKKIATLILSAWSIVYDKQEVYTSKRKKEENIGVDEGGPSRQFITDVFKQLGSLSVCSELGKDCVKLFEHTSSGVAVVTDDSLEQGIKKAVKICANMQVDSSTAKSPSLNTETIIEQAKGYVRAIGRIMLHAFAHGQTLPSNAMPPFFLNVMLRGYDDDYDNNAILEHITLLDVAGESTLEWLLDPHSGERDEDGKEWSRETVFAKYIPSKFIYTRKNLLGALRDGLSDFKSKSGNPKSDDLVEGCGLSDFFSVVPLKAIQQSYFARPEISIVDLLGCIHPNFGEGEPLLILRMSEEDKARVVEEQKKFYNGNFKKYLKESAIEDESFLVRFVECATGSNYLPYDKDFKITIEFNFSLHVQGYPNFHSCTKEVSLPGYEAFFSDYKTFKEEKMNQAIQEVYNQFQMK